MKITCKDRGAANDLIGDIRNHGGSAALLGNMGEKYIVVVGKAPDEMRQQLEELVKASKEG